MPMASTCSQESTTSSSQDGSSSSAAIYVDEQEEPPHPSTYLHSHRPPEINKSNNSLITNTQNNSLDAPHTNAHPTHHHNSQPQPPPLSQPQQPQRTRSGSASYTLHHHPRSSSSSSFSINVDDGTAAQPYTQTSSKPMRSYSHTKTSIFSDDYTAVSGELQAIHQPVLSAGILRADPTGPIAVHQQQEDERSSERLSVGYLVDRLSPKEEEQSEQNAAIAGMDEVREFRAVQPAQAQLRSAHRGMQQSAKMAEGAAGSAARGEREVLLRDLHPHLHRAVLYPLPVLGLHDQALVRFAATHHGVLLSDFVLYLVFDLGSLAAFFNQYFVFALKASADFDHLNSINNNNDNFCPSLIRTYIVYGFSLCCTGIIGSVLQSYTGIADEFVFFLTLPTSGCINYYLLRYCHSKHNASHSGIEYQYHAVPSNEESKYYHSKPRHHHHREHHGHHKEKYSRSSSNILFPTHHAGKLNKHHHHKLVATKPHKSHSHKASKHHTHNKHSQAMDDIVIV
eukprot:CAMPEP_0197073222 /NCGR_PEP_ID=MMETSP1384-20130603/210496_1 /TAXON_ID=29189 /ORGANISM="Ammonia sp." /LENGTH=509 /DNA_ID=CAMNT_0042512055 /DNA_START=199 /DNA_END=1728 /DNA_ORIENTATION=-